MLNKVIIMGRLATEPERKQTAGGTAVTSFRVAVERNRKSANGETETDFFTVVAWRNTADFICRYFKKGNMIAVDGTLQTRQYKDRQQKMQAVVEIQAEKVSFCGEKTQKAPFDEANFEEAFFGE